MSNVTLHDGIKTSLLGLAESQVRKWIANYRQGKYDAAIAAGTSLAGSGGRPKTKRGRARFVDRADAQAAAA